MFYIYRYLLVYLRILISFGSGMVYHFCIPVCEILIVYGHCILIGIRVPVRHVLPRPQSADLHGKFVSGAPLPRSNPKVGDRGGVEGSGGRARRARSQTLGVKGTFTARARCYNERERPRRGSLNNLSCVGRRR